MRPNVLLICADMVSARHLGCYGDSARVTPNLDRLAVTGTRFDQAYCATTPCIPARASLMSGQYAHTHGKMAHLKMELKPRPMLLPELLTAAGYQTGLVGKTHWWPPTDDLGCEQALITIDNHLSPELGDGDDYLQYLRAHGLFDYRAETWEEDKVALQPDNLPADALKVNWTRDAACAMVSDYAAGDRPFFVMCSFVEPHGVGSVQREQYAKLTDAPIPPIIPPHDSKPATQQRAVERWLATYPAADHYRYRQGVYASINLVDQAIGALLDTLDATGERDNTLIIFLSDHGDLMFDHGCIEKTFLYDAAVRVPWIMAGPGVPVGATRDHFASHIDLLPTVLDWCSISPPPRVEGRSLRSIIDDEANPWRDMLFCEVEQSVHLRDLVRSSIAKMVRSGPWKYIYTLVDGQHVEEELYYLDVDPDEVLNLAGDPAQRTRMDEFRAEILRWLVATEVNRLHPVPENHYPVPKNDN